MTQTKAARVDNNAKISKLYLPPSYDIVSKTGYYQVYYGSQYMYVELIHNENTAVIGGGFNCLSNVVGKVKLIVAHSEGGTQHSTLGDIPVGN